MGFGLRAASDFQNPVSVAQAYRQFGNYVVITIPPRGLFCPWMLLARALLTSIKVAKVPPGSRAAEVRRQLSAGLPG